MRVLFCFSGGDVAPSQTFCQKQGGLNIYNGELPEIMLGEQKPPAMREMIAGGLCFARHTDFVRHVPQRTAGCLLKAANADTCGRTV